MTSREDVEGLGEPQPLLLMACCENVEGFSEVLNGGCCILILHSAVGIPTQLHCLLVVF